MLKRILYLTLFYFAGGVLSHASAQSTSVAPQEKIERLIKAAESRTAKLEGEVKALRAQLLELEKSKPKKVEAKKIRKPAILNPEILNVGYLPIVTSPYLVGSNVNGVQLDPSGLIVTLPAYNHDFGLLKQRQELEKILGSKKQGLVQMSGMVEAQVTKTRNPDGSSFSDIDLSEAELHLSSELSPWVLAFFSVAYDNTPLPNTNIRLNNSALFLDRAFIIIGNLDQTPFYMTIGQRFVAFGHYDNYMATAPLTRLLGRVRARQISVSYQHSGDTGMYATIFAFRGDTQVFPSSRHINQIGGSLVYEFKNDYVKTDIGVDYINNLADSEGMTSLVFNQNGILMKRAPAVALHAKIGIGAYMFIAEYIRAITPFDVSNIGFNGVGARPQALDTALVYSFNTGNKPSDFSIGYAQTREALALFMPERRFAVNYNLVILKDTILSVEYYRDYNYSAISTATAQGALRSSTGGYSDTVTGMLTYYF
jgi:hypothetical protein